VGGVALSQGVGAVGLSGEDEVVAVDAVVVA
jgi:hypothetical protein